MTNQDYFRDVKELVYRDENFSLQFRPLEERDAEVIHEAVVISLESFLPFMEWAHKEQSVVGQIERIRKSKEEFAKGTECDFSVFDQNTGEFLMSATLSISKAPNRKGLAIGYWTTIKHCNKG